MVENFEAANTTYTMKEQLNIELLTSVKKSYFNILALFLANEHLESRYLRCLLKWGFQLHLNPQDLKQADVDISHLKFDDKVEKLEAIYNLVHMIYLDEVVEDVELEVATIYAEKLGLKSSVVGELFKSIATEMYDEGKLDNVRQEIMDFLKLNNT